MQKLPLGWRRAYYYLAGLFVFIITGGTVFYHIVEKFSWLNAYYFSVCTLSTVGYGDFTPKTAAGKLFTTFYIFIGIGIFGAFITVTFRLYAEVIRQRIKNN